MKNPDSFINTVLINFYKRNISIFIFKWLENYKHKSFIYESEPTARIPLTIPPLSLFLSLSLSLSISIYQSSIFLSPLDATQYPYRTDDCKFLLVTKCMETACPAAVILRSARSSKWSARKWKMTPRARGLQQAGVVGGVWRSSVKYQWMQLSLKWKKKGSLKDYYRRGSQRKQDKESQDSKSCWSYSLILGTSSLTNSWYKARQSISNKIQRHILRTVHEKRKDLWQDSWRQLHHDNNRSIWQFLVKWNSSVLEQLPYLSDLVPCVPSSKGSSRETVLNARRITRGS